MPHPLKKVFDRRITGAAATINATFNAYADSGYCYVTLRDTGAQVLAKLAISAQMVPGQEVIVVRTDGNLRSANTNYTVIGTAGSSTPGASPAVEQAAHYPGASITSIDLNPAIVAAGDTVTVRVKGVGFTAVAAFQIQPTYGSPKITNTSPPAITDDLITLTITVASDTPPGDYNLSLGSLRTIENYFQVAAADTPTVPTRSLWAMTETELLRIDLDSMTLFARYAFPDLSSGSGVALVGGFILARGYEEMLKIAYPSGELVATLSLRPSDAGRSVAVIGGKMFYPANRSGGSDAAVYAFDPLDDSEILHDTGATPGAFLAICGDGPLLWVTNTHNLLTLDPSDDSVPQDTGEMTGLAGQALTVTTDHVWSWNAPSARVTQIRKSDLVKLGDSIVMDTFTSNIFQMATVDETVYGNASDKIFKMHGSVDAVILDFSGQPYSLNCVTASGDVLYVGDTDGGITRISLGDFTVTDRTVFEPVDPGFARGVDRILLTI